MSIHPSLKRNIWQTKRSVKKRYERIRSLVLQNKWDKEHGSVYSLPKEKVIRLKLKKEKKVEKLEVPTPPTEIWKPEKKKKKSKDVGKIK